MLRRFDEGIHLPGMLQVETILRHRVGEGAGRGSLRGVQVVASFARGTVPLQQKATSGAHPSWWPSEAIAESESGRAAIRAYARTRAGAELAHYLPVL